ncbi:MAG: hypothetical protein LQ342_001040 [Letrouitia transgressa]|nr:MAG: hypothetical protein LQ342_001040 [Letrouitia transgressa]
MPLLLTETDIVKALLQSDKDSDETLESLIGQNNANSSKRPLNLADPDLLQSYEDLTDYLCRDLKAILPKFDDALIPKEKPPERSSSQDIDRTDPMPFGGHSSRRESSRVNTVPFGKHEKIIKDNPSSPKELLQAKKSESESSSSQGAVSSHGIDRVDPVLLGERVVLRTGVRVPVEGLVELHKHFKDEERKANELVTTLIKIDGGSYHVTNDFSIPVKSAVQEMYKE